MYIIERKKKATCVTFHEKTETTPQDAHMNMYFPKLQEKTMLVQ